MKFNIILIDLTPLKLEKHINFLCATRSLQEKVLKKDNYSKISFFCIILLLFHCIFFQR